ncbi:hypothetical protein [Mucilaginibacter sp. SP1R1]|uniref:hypothetical protein n=1 Tax=Mucilaginibacter sp. SP1R1 TaxID=2723091 RepID=UPI00160E4D82|nr:hypothetical protein [Mucilaginibacter sp. SP1R1]MBB6150476.1 putative methyltransferase [Mucilaginibacter sp. SP1R1]
MNELNLTLLLNIIKNKGNVLRLKREKLSFRQIAEFTEQAVVDGFITYSDNKIILTELGEEFLELHLPATKKKNKAEWIEPDIKNKIKPYPKNEVFLPNRSEFSF